MAEEVPIEDEDSPGPVPLTTNLTLTVFDAWVKRNERDIVNVQLLLAQPITDDPAQIQPQLAEIEAWGERMNSLYADAKTFYYLAKRAYLMPRKDSITDLDRETHQKANVSNQRRVMDTLEGIVEATKSKLILGMSLRKSFMGETTTERP